MGFIYEMITRKPSDLIEEGNENRQKYNIKAVCLERIRLLGRKRQQSNGSLGEKTLSLQSEKYRSVKN